MERESAERFIRFVSVNHDTGCWEWTGALDKTGYGAFKAAGKKVSAHRWGYEHFVGPVPEGLDIDHLCRIRKCVNTAHLEPVTRSVNARRGFSARPRPTHCSHGHAYTETNTYHDQRGYRECRTCRNHGGRNDPIVRVSS